MAAELKGKKILTDLIKQSGLSSNYSVSTVCSNFKNKKTKKNELVSVLTQLCKNVPNSAKHIEEFSITAEKRDPYLCLINFLNNLNLNEKKMEVPKVEKNQFIEKRKNIFESPTLCSTRISENITTSDLNEIKEKIAQAATNGIKSVTPANLLPPISMNHSSNNAISSYSNQNTALSEIKNRKYLWNFVCEELPVLKTNNVAAIPMNTQENIIIKEIIHFLVGIRGNLIVPRQGDSENFLIFTISEQVHPTLREMISEIFPLANYYAQIQSFLEGIVYPDSGQVLQALSAAVSDLLNNYYISIIRLESLHLNRQLNLHKLFYHCRPIMHTMVFLAATVTSISQTNMRGGRILTLLQDQIYSVTGDTHTYKILLNLTQMAAVPYMEMLQLWVLEGVICDPQQEFLIEDNELECRPDFPEQYYADYWEKRYVIRHDKIPRFLEKVADIILRTGKYLNVMRECGNTESMKQTNNLNLQFSHTDSNYLTFINNAYNFASSTLLDLIMKKYDLVGRLLSVKRYFLLQQGDFIEQFMEACEQELAKKVDEVLPMRLENLLELTLRLSTAKHDNYQDDLKTMLLPYGIVTQMSKIINVDDSYLEIDTSNLTGIECFTFGYDVQWPVSIVLNKMSISQYQMLFRQLYYCKHVERLLCCVWISNNNAKKFDSETAELYRSAFTLRQLMMNAIQNIEYYMMIEVIEPNWHIFLENLGRVKNIDEVMDCHQDFLDLCLKNCMLTDADLLKTVIQLCNICIQFCEFIQKVQRHYDDAELNSMLGTLDDNNCESDSEYDNACQTENSDAPTETFSQKVENFEIEFTAKLLGLLKKINDCEAKSPTDKFINLIHRINFNSYYGDKLKIMCNNKTIV